MSITLETTRERFAELAERPFDAPVVMVNLLKFKTPGAGSVICGTRWRWRRISSVSAPRSVTGVRHHRLSSAMANSLGGTQFLLSSTRRPQHSSTW